MSQNPRLTFRNVVRIILLFISNPRDSSAFWLALYRCRQQFGVKPHDGRVYHEIMDTLIKKRNARGKLKSFHRKWKIHDSFLDFMSKTMLYRELNARIYKVIERVKEGADLDSLIEILFFEDERWTQISNNQKPVVFFASHFGCDRLTQFLSLKVPKVACISLNEDKKINNMEFIGAADPKKRILSSALFLKAIKEGAHGVFYIDMGASVSEVNVRFFEWTQSMPAGIAKLIRLQPMSLVPTIAILDRNFSSRVTIHFGEPISLFEQSSEMNDTQIIQKLVDAIETLFFQVSEGFPECVFQFHPHRI